MAVHPSLRETPEGACARPSLRSLDAHIRHNWVPARSMAFVSCPASAPLSLLCPSFQ
jgi:hypothetical protein